MSKTHVVVGGIVVGVVGAGLFAFFRWHHRRKRTRALPLEPQTVLPVTETAGVIPVLEKSFDRLRALLPEVHHGLIDAHQTLVTTLAAKHCDPAHVIETVNPVLADLIAALEDNREIVLDELIADLVETTRDILSGVAMKDLGLLLEAGRRSTALAMASGFL